MSAALTGALYVGDVILAVNGESLINAKHDEAVRALKRAGQVVDLQGECLMATVHIKTYILVQLRQDLVRHTDSILTKLPWDDDEPSFYNHRIKSFALKLAFVTRLCLLVFMLI